MENSLLLLVSFAWAVAIAFVTKMITSHKRPRKNPPPGPITGSVHLISSTSPHRSFHLLSKKNGGIMQIQFGSAPFVIASSPENGTIKELLQTRDYTFASRPPGGKYISYNNSDVTWAPSGPSWRQGRKTYLTGLLNAKTLGSYEHIRTDERRALMSRLHCLWGKPTVVLRDHLYRFTLSTITRTVLGRNYFSDNHSEEKSDIDRWFVLNGVSNIGDVIPWINVFDLQGYVKQMKVLQKDFDNFLNFVLDDHEKNMKTEKDFVPKDMLEILLKLAEDPNLEVN